MILNEDFFDDIEIKDDDLKSGNPELYTDDRKDAKSLLKDMFSSYKQCLRFDFSTPFDENIYKDSWDLFDKTNKWHFFRNTIRRVCRVFDAYGIKYSEPLFCTMYDWYDIKRKYLYINLDIIDIENNKVLVDADKIKLYKHLPTENGLNIFMFIDLPVFNSAKSAYRFLYRMASSLQNILYNYDAAVVFDINKDNQNWYIQTNNKTLYLNSLNIKSIIKSTMLQLLKKDILKLLSPQYKYRQEFDNAQTEIELQDFIKNY